MTFKNFTFLILKFFGKLKRFLRFSLLFFVITGILSCLLMVTPIFSTYTLFFLNKLNVDVASTKNKQTPSMIVILGGGLRKTSERKIVLNKYTKQRLQTAVKLHREKKLPLLFSGVEGKWAKAWFVENKIPAHKLILEKKSLNTCENANFTAIKLKELGVNHIYLVTDAYHQKRAELNFSKSGIYTTPVSASLSKNQKKWDTPKLNFDNSRRAIYEVLAVLRDKYQPQTGKDCLMTPKKSSKPDFYEVNLKNFINNKSQD